MATKRKVTLNENPHEKGLSPRIRILQFPRLQFCHGEWFYSLRRPSGPSHQTQSSTTTKHCRWKIHTGIKRGIVGVIFGRYSLGNLVTRINSLWLSANTKPQQIWNYNNWVTSSNMVSGTEKEGLTQWGGWRRLWKRVDGACNPTRVEVWGWDYKAEPKAWHPEMNSWRSSA